MTKNEWNQLTLKEKQIYSRALKEGKRQSDKNAVKQFVAGLALGILIALALAFSTSASAQYPDNPELISIDYNGETQTSYNTSSLLAFLSDFGLESGSIWDLNGSGGVDTSDLLEMLSAFGADLHTNFEINNFEVTQPFSSGAQGTYTGTLTVNGDTITTGQTEAFLLHPYDLPTPYDLEGLESFTIQPAVSSPPVFHFIQHP